MELPIHCDSPTELTEEGVFKYWGKSAHDSITCPCFTDETISVPGLLKSEYSDCFEKLGCMEINSSSAFFLHNRLGCRIVLEIIKVCRQTEF